ncbi:hypothetical protein ID866_8529 [Astraeus odoratus]|nr:hypothetical protein ID866_8529 [Astraeus odoratus]
MSLPSPAPSPTLKSKDLDPGSNSRKRQRSESMQSTASSVKRSASEGPVSATPVPPAADEHARTTPVPDSDIDSYMLVQGEEDVRSVSLTAPCSAHTPPANSTPPEKFEHIKQLRNRSMRAGETWFLVSRQWYRRWEFAYQGTVDKSGPVEEQDLGPVDNTPLVDQDGNLSSNLAEGVDVEFVPEDVWKAFTAWYGIATYPLPRSVITRGQFGEPSLELRPPRLRVLNLVETESDGPDRRPEYITLSTKDTVRTLGRELVAKLSARVNVRYKVWKMQPGEYDGVQLPLDKFGSAGAVLLEISDKTLEDSLIEFDDVFAVEFQQNGKWISEQLPTAANPSADPLPLFSSDSDFFNRLGNTLQTPQQRRTPPPVASSSSSTSRDTQMTLFKSHGFSKAKLIQEPGTLGLGNMGNTCFMNSALQCLAHTPELTEYFLSGVYQNELNPDNPLGMQGAIAEAFGSLLHRIWAKDSTATSYSPREFKLQLQRFAPQFSGYQQHDSQELVAFLLDGLHEDLNRVRKKPYVEKPDWEGGGDLELARLAQKSWHGYMQRNDSVIVDLFQGQYQSTLVCPECQKVSITFDPFMYLTLPIPVEKKWSHTIYYVPWDSSKPHTKVPVEISRDASFKELRSLLGRWSGVPAENLLTLEVFGNRFYKNLDDSVQCGDMLDNDIIFCFELPCNARQSRLYKKKADDPFIIPVYLTDLHARPFYGYRSQPVFGHPFVAVIDQECAQFAENIYEVVLGRLERWTHNARDLYVWEMPSTPVDTVPVSVPPMDSLTEIQSNGDIVHIEDMAIEDDITDQRDANEEEVAMPDASVDLVPRVTGGKEGIFNMRLLVNQKDFGGGFSITPRSESFEARAEEMGEGEPLLKDGDILCLEFDENMKAYYFGEESSRPRWEHALWETWETFIHPEYEEARKAAVAKSTQGISIDDCLKEFIKEEKLGEDDLWYCPRCKKHQQATKKFDLWKVPDILAVHLKRFSNSRALRDKIDAFVDFPIEGLDLTYLVGQRETGKRLSKEGVDIHELGIHDLDEPLIYDLYAVDEHLGGLGGGHYRAYAFNHVTGQWYHFDDSYVTRTEPTMAVNANAYLLFYKRRSDRPLGGKTMQKIEEARQPIVEEIDPTPEHQLPTPPEDPAQTTFVMPATLDAGSSLLQLPSKPTPPTSPSPAVDDNELPPTFDDAQNDSIIHSSLLLNTPGYNILQDRPGWSTPSSSVEAEGDDDYQKLDSPSGSLGEYWNGNSSASPANSDLSSNTHPMEGQNTDFEEIPRL